jgi:ribosomal protein S18 acetylase RimI-like enzyme
MTIALPEGFTARPATLDDADAAVELVNLCSVELIGRPEFEAHEFRNDWQSPSLNPETNVRLVYAPDGTMVGYGGVWDSAPHVQMHVWGNVRPAYRGRGIGTYLAAWVEARARGSIPKAPEGVRVTVDQMKLDIDAPARDLLLAGGYRLVRYFIRMLIEMDDPPPAPALPEGVAIRTLADLPGTAQERLWPVIHAERDIFRDHFGYVEMPLQEEYDEWWHWIDNDPDHAPSLWFLAMADDQVVGVSLCQPKTAEDPNMSYVMSLGVRRPWRRQGVALALLHHTFGEFYRRGKRTVALDVDAESLTGATRLYQRAGMHEQRRSVVYEKELRAGIDPSTRSLAEADDRG